MPPVSTLRLSLLRACYAVLVTILFNCAVVLPFVFVVPWRYVAGTFLGTRQPFRAAATAEGSAA
jgi:hypothetical protein